jgi:4-diphosphocytidyl-2-C-methyl-D-erythritol kinase
MRTPVEAQQLQALAKLTLSLRITGVRRDGYHLLEAEMVTVDLADTLYFSSGCGLEVVDAGTNGRARGEVPADSSNLVLRALALAGRRAHVKLVKRIPVGGGLGGGSADAACVLRWAGWAGDGLGGLSTAARLGADVPFCLAGGGHARVGGIGEVVEPLSFEQVDGQEYTLLTPPFGVPTAAVYQTWDEMGGPTDDRLNHLEPAALKVEPRLGRWRDRLGEATGLEPVLAGSGSTWFVPGAHYGQGLVVVRVTR